MEQRKQEGPKVMATFSHCLKVDYVMAIICSILVFPMTYFLTHALGVSNELLIYCAIDCTIYWLLELKLIFRNMEEKLVLSDTQVHYSSGGWIKFTQTMLIYDIASCENSKNLLQRALGTSTLKIYATGDRCIEFRNIEDGEIAERIINNMLK